MQQGSEGGKMSNDVFDPKILTDKLSKLNNSQQSIESLSRWCISHRKKARQVVETWEKMFNSSQKEQCVSFLYLANDILQNSRKRGSEFVNEFWKVLPAALRHIHENGNELGRKTVSRLVDIWEERKVFGSRGQNLKDEILGREPSLRVSTTAKSNNPVKIVKKDAHLLRIKLEVGNLPEKIVTAFHNVHDGCSNEESTLANCNAAVLSVEGFKKELESNVIQGVQPRPGVEDDLGEQENVLQQCVSQLEGSETTRMTMVSLLNEALKDQELKLEILRGQLQIARCQMKEAEDIRQKLASLRHPGGSTKSINTFTEPSLTVEFSKPPVQATSSLQDPLSEPPNTVQLPLQLPPLIQPSTTFASLSATEEDKKKAVAAAVAAKLAASTSSAQMLTSVLSSLVAEEAAKKSGFSANGSVFSPEKRPKLEHPSPATDAANSDSGSSDYFTHLQQTMSASAQPMSHPPPPPPLPQPFPPTSFPANQFLHSGSPMMGAMPYGYSGIGLPPPPPPLSNLAMGLARPPSGHQNQQLQPLQQPQQSSNGSYHRPPGIGLYGQNNQPATPPVHRQ